jgi:hypothetical protein
VLADKLQNEFVELTRLTCRSYTAVILKDLTDVTDKILAQSNEIARNSAE